MFISILVRLAISNLLASATGALVFTIVTILILCASMGIAIWVVYRARELLLKSDSVHTVDDPDSPPTVAESTNCLTDKNLAIMEMTAGDLLIIVPGVAIFFPSIQRIYCVLPLYAGSLVMYLSKSFNTKIKFLSTSAL